MDGTSSLFRSEVILSQTIKCRSSCTNSVLYGISHLITHGFRAKTRRILCTGTGALNMAFSNVHLSTSGWVGQLMQILSACKQDDKWTFENRHHFDCLPAVAAAGRQQEKSIHGFRQNVNKRVRRKPTERALIYADAITTSVFTFAFVICILVKNIRLEFWIFIVCDVAWQSPTLYYWW